MAKAYVSTTLQVLGQAAWNMIDGVNALAPWHRRSRRARRPTRPSGRKLTLRGSDTAIERLKRHNDKERNHTYSILQNPLPRLRMGESAEGHSWIVEWSSEFQRSGTRESATVKVIHGVYEAGFEDLRGCSAGNARPPHGDPRGRSAPSAGGPTGRQQEERS